MLERYRGGWGGKVIVEIRGSQRTGGRLRKRGTEKDTAEDEEEASHDDVCRLCPETAFDFTKQGFDAITKNSPLPAHAPPLP